MLKCTGKFDVNPGGPDKNAILYTNGNCCRIFLLSGVQINFLLLKYNCTSRYHIIIILIRSGSIIEGLYSILIIILFLFIGTYDLQIQFL